jgi:hypothetical protein
VANAGLFAMLVAAALPVALAPIAGAASGETGISGVVTDAANPGGVANVCVYAESIDDGSDYWGQTGPGGAYEIDGLTAGTYNVLFEPSCAGSPDASEWYPNTFDYSDAGVVTVADGVVTPSIDVALVVGGSISGHVSDAGDPGGALNVCVYAGDGDNNGNAVTDGSGDYTIVGLPAGDYQVQFDPNCAGPPVSADAPQFYGGSTVDPAGVDVPVSFGGTVTGMDAVLQPGGSISGTVVAASDDSPATGTCVYLYGNSQLSFNSSSETASDGTYQFNGLPAGQYEVEFDPTCGGSVTSALLPGWYPNVLDELDDTLVTVAAGQPVSGIDEQLSAAATISGTVTDTTSSPDVGAVCVSADPSSFEGYGGSTQTAADGTYSISGLAPGSYLVYFDPTCGGSNSSADLAQWYGGVTDESSATPVNLTAGQTVDDVSAVLQVTGSISGKVIDASHPQGLSGVCVSADETNGDEVEISGTTDSSGSYDLTGAEPGTYQVYFDPSCNGQDATPDLPRWYDNATQNAAATLTITSGATLDLSSETLLLGGAITGKVTDSAHPAGSSGVCVTATPVNSGSFYPATSTRTGSGGTYRIEGLASGAYQVEFDASCGGSKVSADAYQWYPDEASAAAAKAVTVAVGKTTAGVNGALAIGGTISGVVSDTANPHGLAGVCVTADNSLYEFSRTTGVNGSYAIVGLPAGSYQVNFDPTCSSANVSVDLQQWYSGAASSQLGQKVAVSLGKVVANVNASLVLGGSITGTVTDPSDPSGLAGVCVTAYPYLSYDEGDYQATSAVDGTYTIVGLPTGDYQVEFDPTCDWVVSSDDVAQWYPGTSDESSAASVAVVVSQATSGVDAELELPGSISGTVTDPADPGGVGDVCVTATSPSGTSQEASTAPDGSYEIDGLPADTYDVEFDQSCQGELPASDATQWYGGGSDPDSAVGVDVSADAATTGIDAQLMVGGSISGTVTDLADPHGLGSVCITATNGADGSTHTVTSNSDGTYAVTGLSAGSYTIEFDPTCSINTPSSDVAQWYPGAPNQFDATPVSVTLGAVISGIDASLVASGGISGKVVDAKHPGGLVGVCVAASSSDGGSGGGSATTTSGGRFEIDGLAPDSYAVQFDPTCSGYATSADVLQWYGGASQQTSSPALSVAAGKVTNGVNATLATGGTISGKVIDKAHRKGLGGVCVTVISTNGDGSLGSAITGSAGAYSVGGLRADSYSVEFDPTCAGRSASADVIQWYTAATSSTSAKLVKVKLGKATKKINATLLAGGTITGRVTDAADPSGLAQVCVTASSISGLGPFGQALTSESGNYAIEGLPAGSYDVEFDPTCAGTQDSPDAPLWFSGATSATSATTVVVASGKTKSGVSAVLPVAATISGAVTDAADPAGLPGVCALAYASSTMSLAAETVTASDGSYTLSGLGAGTYGVEFDPTCLGENQSTDLPTWYAGGSSLATATPIVLSSGSSRTGVSGSLSVGGGVSGTVTDASHPGGLANVCVFAFAVGALAPTALAITGDNGGYVLTGLASGSYDIDFDPTCGDATTSSDVPAWYGGATQAAATAVVVTAPTVLGYVNETLTT